MSYEPEPTGAKKGLGTSQPPPLSSRSVRGRTRNGFP